MNNEPSHQVNQSRFLLIVLQRCLPTPNIADKLVLLDDAPNLT